MELMDSGSKQPLKSTRISGAASGDYLHVLEDEKMRRVAIG